MAVNLADLLSWIGHEGRRVILNEDDVTRAVGAIGERLSEVAWGRGTWEDVCRSLAGILPGSVPIIRNVDLPRQAVNAMFVEGMDPDRVSAYCDRYVAIDPWLAFASTIPDGEIRVTERDCPSSAFHDSEFYADWLAAQDNLKAATGIRVDVDARHRAQEVRDAAARRGRRACVHDGDAAAKQDSRAFRAGPQRVERTRNAMMLVLRRCRCGHCHQHGAHGGAPRRPLRRHSQLTAGR